MADLRGKRKTILLGLIAGGVLIALVWFGNDVVQRARLDREMIVTVQQNDTMNALRCLDEGADPNARIDPRKPFSAGQAIIDWLRLLTGGKPAAVATPSALNIAIENNNSTLIRDLIARGADVNARTESGQFPLLIETLRGDKEFVQALIDKGANVNARDHDGTTALWSAALYGRVEIAHMLLRRGAGVNIAGSDGTTPLIAAASAFKESLPMVNLLLSRGAKVNARNKEGKTALQFATNQQYTRIAQRLRQAGAKR